jgi:hypothetical protein
LREFRLILTIGFALSHSVAALSVWADPDYLPYSNRAGEGFENKVAAVVAHALGENVEYTWASYRGHGGFPQFLSSTLDPKKGDLVMSIFHMARVRNGVGMTAYGHGSSLSHLSCQLLDSTCCLVAGFLEFS